MKPTVLLVAIGVAIGGGVGYYTFYTPNVERARVIEQRRAQAQADYQAREDVARLLAQVEPYRQRLSPEPDPSWLSREVVASARDAGFELTTITPNTVEPSALASRVGVTLQFVATYHQLGQFLDAIERAQTFLHVDRLQLSPFGQTGQLDWNAQQDPDSRRDTSEPASIQLTVSTLYMRTAP